MKRTKLLTSLFCFAGILALILDGKTALSGARMGIELCIRTVIPCLFPFFFLSVFLTGGLSDSFAGILRPVGKLCGIPQGAEGILVSGFLGGYPVGAKALGDAFRSGQLTRKEANRLLSFCSNAGPAFLFGMAGQLFEDPMTPWFLWAIHLFSAFLVSQIVFFPGDKICVPGPSRCGSASDAMSAAVHAMAQVCGWVVLFRVVIAFLSRWVLWALPDVFQVIVSGFLELSNGCLALMALPEEKTRFVLCAGMLSWGGVCVLMQTSSVTEGLSLTAYLRGKALQTLFSMLLSTGSVLGFGLPMGCMLCLLALILRNRQKRDSIPAVSGV